MHGHVREGGQSCCERISKWTRKALGERENDRSERIRMCLVMRYRGWGGSNLALEVGTVQCLVWLEG